MEAANFLSILGDAKEKKDWEKQKDLIKQKWLLVSGSAKKAYSDH